MNKLSKIKIFTVFLLMMSSAAHSQNSGQQLQFSLQAGQSGAASESDSEEFSPGLSKITFSGLKRTHDWFLQEQLSSYIGKNPDKKTLSSIESDLQALNLFSEIHMELSEDSQSSGRELKITLKEKISFIPLPFAMYSSSSGFMAGAFIMDMNAGGKKDMFVTGLMWAFDRQMLVGMYRNSPRIGTPGYLLSASLAKQKLGINDSDGNEFFKVENFYASAIAKILFKLDRFNSFGAGLGYSGFFPRDDESLYYDIYARNAGLASLDWSISENNWNGTFLSETAFAASASFLLDNKLRPVTNLALSARVQQPLVQKLRLNIEGGAAMVLNGLVIDGLRKSSARVTIMNDKFVTEKIAGSSTGLEYAFLQTKKIGTFSIYGNYEFLFAEDIDQSLLFCQGFNTGMKVYLKGLAFPALSMGLAYNATKNIFYFAGSFGVSF